MSYFMTQNSEILAGLYIHIPFCKKKCFYCDFYSVTDLARIPIFIAAMEKEMQLTNRVPLVFDTIYIGGGTPSMLGATDVARIIALAFKHFKIMPGAEVTMEVNPGTASLADLKDYRSAGINRLNIGVQSFHPENLKFLDRIHTAEQALSCLEGAYQAGFANVGLDLIYGLPAQGPNFWREDLARAVDIGPEHLSCYMLTREAGTPLDKAAAAGRIQMASETVLRVLFETTIDYLTGHGYLHYEVSNFARRGADAGSPWQSRHNLKYWSMAPYTGLGPSAHSFMEPERYWNHRSVQKYIQSLQAGKPPIEGKEKLTREQLLMEAIYLGFRTAEGIDLSVVNNKFGMDFSNHFSQVIAEFEKEGLLKLTETRCALTIKGMALLDSVTTAFTSQDF